MGYIASKSLNLKVVKEKTYKSEDGKRRLCIVRVTHESQYDKPYVGRVQCGGTEVSAGHAKTKSGAWKKAYKRARRMVPRDQKHMLDANPSRTKKQAKGRTCPTCKGNGRVRLSYGSSQTCHRCGGDGKVGVRKCYDCGTLLTYCSIYGWFCEKCDFTNYDGHAAKHKRGECKGAAVNQDLADDPTKNI